MTLLFGAMVALVAQVVQLVKLVQLQFLMHSKCDRQAGVGELYTYNGAASWCSHDLLPSHPGTLFISNNQLVWK